MRVAHGMISTHERAEDFEALRSSRGAGVNLLLPTPYRTEYFAAVPSFASLTQDGNRAELATSASVLQRRATRQT
jgi:hypothetical protein